MANINVVVLSGNLTRDPEYNDVGERGVCKLGLAVNERKKEGDEWVDVPSYFDVSVWSGPTGPAAWCRDQLSKGSPVTVHGRLKWRSFEVDGQKRSAIEVVAYDVILPPRTDHAPADDGPGF